MQGLRSRRSKYTSSLSENQWDLIREYIPKASHTGRPRKTDNRAILDALLYVVKSGCAWRDLPVDFPPWQTVYYYFKTWRDKNILRALHNKLAKRARKREGRSSTPSTVIIDGQSVRSSVGEERGWDGFKKVRGRKRQILVDTTGIIWGTAIHRANQAENNQAHHALLSYNEVKNQKRPQRVVADAGYRNRPFKKWVEKLWKSELIIRKGVHEPYRDKYFQQRIKIIKSNLKPQRWVVERSFAWMNFSRRLARDYEKKVKSSEAFLYLSQIKILLRRLERPTRKALEF